VLAVTKAKDFDVPLALPNDSEFALTGGLYSPQSGDIERGKRVRLRQSFTQPSHHRRDCRTPAVW